jgi:hypothetical protein
VQPGLLSPSSQKAAVEKTNTPPSQKKHNAIHAQTKETKQNNQNQTNNRRRPTPPPKKHPKQNKSLVKRAMHGTRMMSWQEIRDAYGREVVNLRNEGRWVFLNTLFSVSEAVMYMQV